jgi:hypothetical protein
MKYFNEDGLHINAECEICHRVLKIKKEQLQEEEEQFKFIVSFRCICGNIVDRNCAAKSAAISQRN